MSLSNSFKEKVRDWVAFDDKIAKANQVVGKVREKKKSIGEDIVDFMKSKNLETKQLKVKDSRLSFKIKETPAPMTQKFIKDTLTDYFEDEKAAKEAVKFMYNPRKKMEACLTILLGNDDDAKDAVDFIYSRRPVTVKKTVIRKKKRTPASIPVSSGPISREAKEAMETPPSTEAEAESEEYSEEYSD